jgi:SAM-dependent methyltransferase
MKDALFDSIAGFYDAEIKKLIKFKDDVPFYLEYAKECGGEVLELACGTGRALIRLAEKGIKITGLDTSAKMLNQARQKIKELPEHIKKNIELIQTDMQNFNLDKRFSLIFCTFRSFQHLMNREAQGACLNRVHEHLTDKGIFVVHLFVPFHHLLAQEQRTIELGSFEDPESGHQVSRRSEVTYNLADQTLHEDRYYEWTDKDGKACRHIWSFDLAYLFKNEVELLLERYCFTVVNIFGDFDRSPYNYFSGEQIFVSKKKVS